MYVKPITCGNCIRSAIIDPIDERGGHLVSYKVYAGEKKASTITITKHDLLH